VCVSFGRLIRETRAQGGDAVRAIVTSFILVALFTQPARAQSSDSRELWLYYPNNFQVAENVDKLEAVWTRAAKAGYTHVYVVDSKFAKLGDVPDTCFKYLNRAKEIAARLKL
jgi:hypothetical protein